MRTPRLHLGSVRAAARVGALVVLAAISGCAPSLPFAGAKVEEGPHTPHWSYAGSEGPEHWGELAPDFDLCSTGKQQSPIDVPRSKLLPADWLLPLQVSFKASKVQMVNNGHTIQVNYEAGSSLNFEKTTYQLKQFHFHSPSEHKVNGVGADMETHLVFSDSLKHLAVIGIMMNAGQENPFFAKFWHALPDKEGAVNREITVNVGDLLPADRDYYTYDGSLTTPPCSEGVTWILLKTRVDASADQINRFRAIFGGGTTARPVQPINDRLVKDEDKTASAAAH
jgi:carbonic anhydrase